MKLLLSILDAVLVIASFCFVGGELEREISPLIRGDVDRWLAFFLFCGGIVYLHWSLWRLLVPRALIDDPCADFFYTTRRGFYKGAISYGYLMLFGYAAFILFPLVSKEPQPPQGIFWLGTAIVLIGIAGRVRAIIVRLATKLSAQRAFENSSSSQAAPTLRANS